MTVPLWAWAAFVAFVVAVLALDLFVLHRRAHQVSLTEAGAWSAVWVALGLGFGGLLWVWRGGDIAQAYLAGYLIEKSLSLDNVFVFTVIFAMFAIPPRYQHRVLMAGIIGALCLRAAFIAGGAALLHSFHVVVYVFGAVLLWTAIRMLRSGGHLQPGRGLPRVIQRVLPTTGQLHGQRFLVREGGRWRATPLLAALIVVEVADVIFAVDSIPAIFAVTTDTFVVFTSNVFALLGLRALYFLLAGAVGRLRYLRPGLSVILAAAAGKLLLSDIYAIPVWVSPAFILSVLAVVAVMSRWDPLTRPAAGPHPASASPRTLPPAAPPTLPPAAPPTRPTAAPRHEGQKREGSGLARERDDAADGVNTVYSRQ
jgi:tellurite resistance protein TerC